MYEKRKPRAAANPDEAQDEVPAPSEAEQEAEKEAEANLLAKIEMSIFGHP